MIIATSAQLATIHGDNEHITVHQLSRGTRVVAQADEGRGGQTGDVLGAMQQFAECAGWAAAIALIV